MKKMTVAQLIGCDIHSQYRQFIYSFAQQLETEFSKKLWDKNTSVEIKEEDKVVPVENITTETTTYPTHEVYVSNEYFGLSCEFFYLNTSRVTLTFFAIENEKKNVVYRKNQTVELKTKEFFSEKVMGKCCNFLDSHRTAYELLDMQKEE